MLKTIQYELSLKIGTSLVLDNMIRDFFEYLTLKMRFDSCHLLLAEDDVQLNFLFEEKPKLSFPEQSNDFFHSFLLQGTVTVGQHRFEDKYLDVLCLGSDRKLVLVSSRKFINQQVLQAVHPILSKLNLSIDACFEHKRVIILKKEASLKELKLDEALLAAESSSRAKSDFLANMSHELRTPLNGILGMSQVLASQLKDIEHLEATHIIQKSAEILLGILNDILDFSKIEAGKMNIEKIPFILKEELEDILVMSSINAKNKDLVFSTSYQSDLPRRYKGDPLRIKQIVMNLVSNAMKFTQYGHIEVKISHFNGRLKIAVEDTGGGISPDKLSSIFEAFTQEDTTTSRKFGGTGLGLTISQRLAQLMGGTLHVESKLGVGSTFSLELPIEVVQDVDNKVDETCIVSREYRSLKILVAEDNLVNQKIIRSFLEKLGHSVDIAPDGAHAVKQYLQGHYDLVLMDIQMPILNGYEATSEIRKIQTISGYKPHIVALTAHALKGDKEKCLESGMDDYLTKPIFYEELKKVINRNRLETNFDQEDQNIG